MNIFTAIIPGNITDYPYAGLSVHPAQEDDGKIWQPI
jgi:hypothetical protein